MSGKLSSLALAAYGAMAAQLFVFWTHLWVAGVVFAEQASAADEHPSKTCCDQECKNLLAGFLRASEDDLQKLQDASLRFPCNRNCQLAKSLLAMKTKGHGWGARFPELLPEGDRKVTEPCFHLLKGRQITGGLVALEVLVDSQGNPQKVNMLRGIPEEDFNSCIQSALLRACYRPALKDGKFVDGTVTITVNICVR